MNMPAIITRERMFNSSGELVHNEVSSQPDRHPMDRLCDSLDLPIKSVGKYVKESREARLLTFCIILGKKLKIIWPRFVEGLAIWEFLNEILEKRSNSLLSLTRKGDFNTYCVFLGILRKEREINIAKMSFQFRSILKRLRMIQSSLVQYSRSNLGIFEELKRIKIPNYDQILFSRVKLSDCEKSLAERIDGIVRGFVKPDVNQTIFLSWKEFFEKVKRKRRTVEQMLPPEVKKQKSKSTKVQETSKMFDEDDQNGGKDHIEKEEEEEVNTAKRRKIITRSKESGSVSQSPNLDDSSETDNLIDDEDDDDNENEDEDKNLRTRRNEVDDLNIRNDEGSNNNNILPPPPRNSRIREREDDDMSIVSPLPLMTQQPDLDAMDN